MKLREVYVDLLEECELEKAKKAAKEFVAQMRDLRRKDESKGEGNISLTYGEIDFFSFLSILERLEPKRGDVFVDLGHGTGKAIVCASLMYGHIFSKLVGIEIIPELNKMSKRVVEKLLCKFTTTPLFENHSVDVQVYEGDFRESNVQGFDWTTADLIFANSTCFDDLLMNTLGQMTNNLRIGAKIVTFTRELRDPLLQVLDRRQLAMSWGTATCYIHERVQAT